MKGVGGGGGVGGDGCGSGQAFSVRVISPLIEEEKWLGDTSAVTVDFV